MTTTGDYTKRLFSRPEKKPTPYDVLAEAGILRGFDRNHMPVFNEEITDRIPDEHKRLQLMSILSDRTMLYLLVKDGQMDVRDKLLTSEKTFDLLDLDKTGLWQGDLNQQIRNALDALFPSPGKSL